MKYDTKVPGFTIQAGYYCHTFHEQPFAPPSGQTAFNYCRYIHKEQNATRYMIVWYPKRVASCKEGIKTGGNFFLADYGIRVKNTEDTAIVWEPRKAYGTS